MDGEMDFNRKMTQFALDAEYQAYGSARIAVAMNKQLETVEAQSEQIAALKAEVAAMMAQLDLPNDYCLACGGNGGHTEGCLGTTGLIALQAEVERLKQDERDYISTIKRIDDTFGEVVKERDTLRARLAMAVRVVEAAKNAVECACVQAACMQCVGPLRDALAALVKDV